LAGGQIAVHYGLSTPFWIVIASLICVYIWVWISFHDPYIPDKDKAISYFKTFTNLATVFTDIPIRKVYLVNFLIYFGLFGIARTITIYIVDEWNFSLDKVTLYYAVASLACGISNLFFFAPLARRFSLKSIAIWSGLIGGTMLVLVVIPKAEYTIWFTSIPSLFIIMWAISACGAYISTLVGPERQGRVLGNNLALQVGAESLGAALGGFLAAIFVPLSVVTYGVAIIIGSLILITYKTPKEVISHE